MPDAHQIEVPSEGVMYLIGAEWMRLQSLGQKLANPSPAVGSDPWKVDLEVQYEQFIGLACPY